MKDRVPRFQPNGFTVLTLSVRVAILLAQGMAEPMMSIREIVVNEDRFTEGAFSFRVSLLLEQHVAQVVMRVLEFRQGRCGLLRRRSRLPGGGWNDRAG